jgi:hypothetical protein
MKSIRHKDQINGLGPQAREVLSIASNKAAVRGACFHQAHPRNLQQRWSNVDRRDVPGDLCDLQRKPTIARTQIDHLHAGLRPMRTSTLAGSGHNASDQPAVGISVPSKNSRCLSHMSLI